MSHIKDLILSVTGGPTVNDGLLSFYLANGATSQNRVDAEYEFLLARGVTSAYINDMWEEFFTTLGYIGALSDKKYQWWSAGAPLIP